MKTLIKAAIILSILLLTTAALSVFCFAGNTDLYGNLTLTEPILLKGDTLTTNSVTPIKITRADGYTGALIKCHSGNNTITGNITIDGGNIATDFPLIEISAGATLTLGSGVKITGLKGNNNTSVSAISVNGTLILNGAEITGNSGHAGAAVSVLTSARFVMNSGSIHDNTAHQGAAIYLMPNVGSVPVNFMPGIELNGGGIYNNTSYKDSYPDSWPLYLSNGNNNNFTVTFKGINIYDNKSLNPQTPNPIYVNVHEINLYTCANITDGIAFNDKGANKDITLNILKDSALAQSSAKININAELYNFDEKPYIVYKGLSPADTNVKIASAKFMKVVPSTIPGRSSENVELDGSAKTNYRSDNGDTYVSFSYLPNHLPESDYPIIANYAQRRVTLSVNDSSMGSADIIGTTYMPYTSERNIKITANDGFHLADITLNGVSVLSEARIKEQNTFYTLKAGYSAAELEVVFAEGAAEVVSGLRKR